MIPRGFIVAACFVSHAALAAQPPRNAAEFAQLPALGKLVEGGMEKDYRFRTYLVSKRPTSTGAIEIYVGEVHMRVQDISGGASRTPYVLKWKYAARCSGDANTISVYVESIQPRETRYVLRQEVLLWGPLPFLLLALVVTCEWVLRKLTNLS